MARTANTFLIDLSKKIVITGGGFENNMILYGDLKDDSLFKTSFSFSEDFDSGTAYMEDKLDAMLKPVTAQLQALMKKLPFLGDTASNIAGPHFKDNLAFAYTFLQHTMNNDPKRDDAVANTLNGLFNYIVPYNIPMRKKVPTINTSKPKGITIEFAYGKCNKYNAHDEVYAPIETLRAAIMPVIGKEGDDGLVSVQGLNTLPFPQQLFIRVIESIVNKGEETAKNIYAKIPIIGTAAAKLNDSSGGLQGLVEDLTKGLSEDNPYKDRNFYVGHGTVYQLKNLDAQWHTKTGEALKKSIDDAISKQPNNTDETGNPKFKTFKVEELSGEDVAAEYKRIDVKDNQTPDDVASGISKKSYFTSSIKSLGEVMATEALTKSGFDVEPGQIAFEGRLRDDLSGLTSPGVKVPDAKMITSITTTLAGIAKWPDEIVAKAAKQVYEDWVKNKCLTIYYGFPQRFFTSIEELTSFLITKDKYKTLARIRISGVVLAGADFNLNLGNLDEFGFPMDGTVVLSNLWSVLPPTQVLSFNGRNVIDQDFRHQDNAKAL